MACYVPFNDQMNTNNWDSTVEFFAISKRLQDLGWVLETKEDVGFALLNKEGKTIEISMAHPCITDRDYIILDSVYKNKNALSLAPGIYGHFYHEFEYVNRLPTKRFNCFIYRSCPARQSWFYTLVREELLDQGHISYWCKDVDNNTSPVDYFEQLYNGNEIFANEHDFIKNNLSIPYKNFDLGLDQSIIDSEKSLTIETFFSESDVITFSEKTWRSLQLPRPFLIFGHPGSIQQLREWGFDVYDDYVNHDYDNKDFWIDRQQMILQETKKPIEYTPALLDEFEQRAKHNRQLLKKYKIEFIDFFENFLYNLKNL